jgi:PhoPQ-activated pathogenicity-related protein
LSILAILLSAGVVGAAEPTALDEFVYAGDPDAGYEVVGKDDKLFHTRYDLQLTSGSWRSAEEVDRVLWTHWISIYVPDNISAETALLIISGGSNDGSPDFGQYDDVIGPISVITGSVIIDLGQVPNQPIVFAGESGGRSEDALIAHSWRQFLDDPSDTSWPAQLPMTRAAVAAMDSVEDFMGLIEPADPIGDFIVAGASKRGWTTWLTAAVENGPLGRGRVSAIIPIVIDTLNLEHSFNHHFQVYGFWAPAVGDYVESGIMDYLGTPEGEALFALVDPYAYRDRLTMPKVILNSAGDQFFLPDSSKFYADDLPGETWLRYYPNTDHTLSQIDDPIEEILLLYGILLDAGSEAKPDYTWSLLEDGTLELQTSESAPSVKLWQATNPEARDFRYEEIGAAYTSTVLADLGGKTFRGRPETPETGWTAYFLELSFPDGTAATTGVQLITAEEPLQLGIRRNGQAIDLEFNSKPGLLYELYSGPAPDQLILTDTLVPTGLWSTWTDPGPLTARKFYQLRSVSP